MRFSYKDTISPACGAAILAGSIYSLSVPNPLYVCLWAAACFLMGFIVGKAK